MASSTIVERLLPARFLSEYAVYMQTCAHLELVCWHIVQAAQNLKPTDMEQIHSLLEIKLSSPRLIRELKRSASLVDARIGMRIALLTAAVADGVETRNAAAHGAWFVQPETGALNVEHYFARGKRDGRQWFHNSAPVTERAVRDAIETADRTLGEAISIRELLWKHPTTPEFVGLNAVRVIPTFAKPRPASLLQTTMPWQPLVLP